MSLLSAIILTICLLPALFGCLVWFAVTDYRTKPIKHDKIDK